MSKISVKELCVISIMACIEAVMFTMFSQVLYLEGITLTVLLFACVFQCRTAFLAAVVYGFVNMVFHGITPWTMMYLLIYPVYTLIVCGCKRWISHRVALWAILCGFLSFLTGQLLQLPFLLVSKTVTAIYLLTGLKTSLIQGCLSAVLCFLLFQPLRDVLERIERRLNV